MMLLAGTAYPVLASRISPRTDRVTPRGYVGLPVRSVSVAPLLADVIARLDRDESLGDLVPHG
ncbi:MAG: hypothetical protein ACM4AI_02240 [Acidobacteriota bacterium]